jgi:hypothetical protein
VEVTIHKVELPENTQYLADLEECEAIVVKKILEAAKRNVIRLNELVPDAIITEFLKSGNEIAISTMRGFGNLVICNKKMKDEKEPFFNSKGITMFKFLANESVPENTFIIGYINSEKGKEHDTPIAFHQKADKYFPIFSEKFENYFRIIEVQ